LSEAEKLKFKRQFEKSKGNCGYEKDPCEEVNDELKAGKKIIQEFRDSVTEGVEAVGEIADSVSDSLGDIGDFLNLVSDEINAIRDGNNEYAVSEWDSILVKLEPDPVERYRLAVSYAENTKSLMLGGFAKSANFAESLLRKQGLWKNRGTAVVLAKRKTAVSGGLTLAFIGFIGSIYKVFVEDCVKEK
jgi:hypothetical protein